MTSNIHGRNGIDLIGCLIFFNNNVAFNTFLLTVILASAIILLEKSPSGSPIVINLRLAAH